MILDHQNFKKKVFSAGGIFPIFFLIVIQFPFIGCGTIRPPFSFERREIKNPEIIISDIKNQYEMVSSFFSSGTINIKDWDRESEANILIAGIRVPLRLKLEVTHPWGKPILHILLKEDDFEAVSFAEKKIYFGKFDQNSLFSFFPGIDLDKTMIWTFCRGYPVILDYNGTEVSGGKSINLTDRQGNYIERVNLDSRSLFPEKVNYPEQNIEMLFSGFKETNGIHYASDVSVDNLNEGKKLTLNIRKMVLNREFNEMIFNLEKPPEFKTEYIE
jgi:hypothetical protein